jgi:hypothetical protein
MLRLEIPGILCGPSATDQFHMLPAHRCSWFERPVGLFRGGRRDGNQPKTRNAPA